MFIRSFFIIVILLTNYNLCAGSSATANLTVSATVIASCTVSAPNVMAFGNYSGALVQKNINILVQCTQLSPYRITMGPGQTGTSVAARKMVNGTYSLGYQLYSDPGYANNWGVTANTDDFGGVGAGTITQVPVFGQINAGVVAPTGVYQDTVLVTVNY